MNWIKQKARQCVVAAVLLPAALFAQPSKSDIAKSIPDDVFVFAHKFATPEDDFSEQAWGRVWKAVVDSGAISETINLFLSSATGPDQQAIQEQYAQVQKIVQSVEWSSLATKESVFAMRFSQTSPIALQTGGFAPPDMIWLLRGDNAAENMKALTSILQYGASLAPEDIVLTSSTIDGFNQELLAIANLINFAVMNREDLIIVSFGSELAADVVMGLSGNSDKGSFVDSDDFAELTSLLPEPEVSISYFNIKTLMDYMKELLDRGISVAELTAKSEEELHSIAATKRMLDYLFQQVTISEWVGKSVHVDNYKVISDSVAKFSEGAEQSMVYKAFYKDRSVEEWSKYIPAEATVFTASAGVDIAFIYDEILRAIRDFIPEGKGEFVLEKWAETQAQYELDFREDILGWISGEIITFSLPQTSLSGNTATLVKVRDEEKARVMVGRFIDTVNNLLKSNNQIGITSRPAASLGDDFRILSHPQFAMVGLNLVVGVQNGYLFLSTTEDAVSRSLATAEGKNPGIASTEKFKSRVSKVGENVIAISYQDLSNLGRELAQGIGMATFGGSIAAAQPDAPPQLRKFFGILNRLIGPLQQINFLDSMVSISAVEGGYVKSTTVIAYKEAVVAPK